MATNKDGDAVQALLDGEIDYLIHVANCQGRMGSGIALAVKEKVPAAYKAYKDHEKEKGLTLGSVSGSGGVINLHAQFYYGYDGKRYINYGALADSLSTVRQYLVKPGMKKFTIGLPYLMGCDRAGGDWEVVLELIEYYFKEMDIIIYKYS